MNAVEIDDAVTELASLPFDVGEFPFQFLAAFGNKATTIKRLRAGATNSSDIESGVLQRGNIHIATCAPGLVGSTLTALRSSPKTVAAKAKFILATDGHTLEAEDLATGETVACDYPDFYRHLGFFLPLAGISTVKEIKNNPFDIKATGRLNRLYVQLLRDNPEWGTTEKRHALNQFMARLIFCFFAEDTGIFLPGQFTSTIEQMSDPQSTNTHEVLAELFRAMDTETRDGGKARREASVKSWADVFPYVNGGMFAGTKDCPRFSKIARSYLLHVGKLEWDKINPDIFGSMIQAVADDDERGDLGMHYTSVPNILRVLNPLFLDDLRERLAEAGDNARKLRNLRKRLARIRVFDPACGSGNFLVIAYKEMREIEHEIITRTGDDPKSWIKLHNFYGIEIKSFAAEIARLSLLIAEFQSDVRMIGQMEARSMVLPLHKTGKIAVGNALRLDWLEVCPPAKGALAEEHDLAGPTGRFALVPNDLAERPETYICGNPPYGGSKWQSDDQKDDLRASCSDVIADWKTLDYVAGWFVKAVKYAQSQASVCAFVSTNSINQGQLVPVLWPYILAHRQISFAHTSFKWANLAARNAGVTVCIVGLAAPSNAPKRLFDVDGSQTVQREVANINAYLVPGDDVIVEPVSKPISESSTMLFGNMPRDGGHLLLDAEERRALLRSTPEANKFVKDYVGSEDFIKGEWRSCLWIEDKDVAEAGAIPSIKRRLDAVAAERAASKAPSTQKFAQRPHRFVQIQGVATTSSIIVPRVSSERRPYLPVGLVPADVIVADSALAIYDAPLWNLALIASRLHLVWIATVCGKLKTDFRYSNTLGWNTFPVPRLTDQNKSDLTECAEGILTAREAYFPATVADLYDSESMPEELRRAHDYTDEVVERIYIGRRFRNDTERLVKLFEMYERLTGDRPENRRHVANG